MWRDVPNFTTCLTSLPVKPHEYISEACHVAKRTKSRIGYADPNKMMPFLEGLLIDTRHLIGYKTNDTKQRSPLFCGVFASAFMHIMIGANAEAWHIAG